MPTNKILMVESDDFVRDLFGKKFEKAGFDFVGLKDFPADFIEQVVAMKPDLISLSMLFPGKKTGIEMLETLKKDARISNVPVFILTNFPEKRFVEKAKSLGAIQWLITAEHTPADVVEIYSKYLRVDNKLA